MAETTLANQSASHSKVQSSGTYFVLIVVSHCYSKSSLLLLICAVWFFHNWSAFNMSCFARVQSSSKGCAKRCKPLPRLVPGERVSGFDRSTYNRPKCACWSSASYRVWLKTLLHATIAACPDHTHQLLGITFTAQDAPTCNTCSVLDLIFMPSQTNEKVGPSCYHRMTKPLSTASPVPGAP